MDVVMESLTITQKLKNIKNIAFSDISKDALNM